VDRADEEVDGMTDQVLGYYNSRKQNLLKDFDETAAMVRVPVVARYGETFANTLHSEIRREYEMLIPDIPYIKGPRGRALNTFLLITAQELAAWKAMKGQGKSTGEAWELCHQAIRARAGRIPRWKRWLSRRFMFSKLVRRIFARREKQGQTLRLGDFEVQYLLGDGEDFDLGVNYLQCGNHRFAMEHGGEEFAPYVCMSDIALSDAMGWGLIRTQTLADGCDRCDFRFKNGARTRISSKTPAVQEAIERIRDGEAGLAAARPPR
jgi:hypothetical protein